ncbi:MAG TPA: ELWxxDGT repeat protein [Tepidisphaeraceae bacterium]|jgi:ELWxxDGT repeat protein
MSRFSTIELLEKRTLLSSNLLADVGGIYPTETVTLNGISYFAATDSAHGKELWRSDGTLGGTWLVKDIIPGTASSSPQLIGTMGDKLIFLVGSSIYASDGTAAGTTWVSGISNTYEPGLVQIVGDKIFSTSTESSQSDAASSSVKIWAGPGKVLLADFKNTDGYRSGFFSSGHAVGNSAVFVYGMGKAYATDGTYAGTFELNTGSPHTISDMVNAGGKLYYLMFEGDRTVLPTVGTYALWSTDGPAAGTQRIGTLGNGATSTFSDLVAAGDRLYFRQSTRVARNVYDNYLWTSDGTADGTHVVAKAPAAFGTSNATAFADGHILLMMNTGDGYATSIFTSDGTPASQLQLVAKLKYNRHSVVQVNGKIYMLLAPYDATKNWELWRTDGTSAGTFKVQDCGRFNFDFAETSLAVAAEKLIVTTATETFALDPETGKPPAVLHQNQMIVEGTDLRIFGSRYDDIIRLYDVTDNPTRFIVNLNGVKKSFAFASITTITIYAYGGNDAITVNEKLGVFPARSRIFAGNGNDSIVTGSGRDTLYGEEGSDYLLGANSSDLISGGTGNDQLFGCAGNDTLSGEAGSDTLQGNKGNDLLAAGNDSAKDNLDGGAGTDVLFGQSVYDTFFKPTTKDASDSDEILQS